MRFVLGKIQRSVIQSARQPETVIDQHLFSRTVTVKHTADLRNSHVRLVDNHQKIIREEVEQRQRRFAFFAKFQMSRIVFDSGAKAGFAHHLHVEVRALGNTLRFNQLVFLLKELDALCQLLFNVTAGEVDFILCHHIVRGRINHDMLQFRRHLAGESFADADTIDFVAEKFHADDGVRALRGEDINRIAAHAKIATLEHHVVAHVLHGNQFADEIAV